MSETRASSCTASAISIRTFTPMIRELLSGGFPDEQTGRPFYRQFPTLNNIYILGNGDNSIYHGLQVTVKQRTRKGLYFVAGYTWSHAIDDSRAIASSIFRTASIPRRRDQMLTRTSVIVLPWRLRMSCPPNPAMGNCCEGWRLNGIFTAQGGSPIFFYDSSNDISGTGAFNDRWNITGSLPTFTGRRTFPFPISTHRHSRQTVAEM